MKFRICLVAFCLLVFYCSAYGQTQTPPAEWEYKQLEYPHPPNINDEAFNYYAKNGWEIVAVDGGKVILKRSRSHPLFGTKTPEPPPPQPPPPQKLTCNLTLAQSPAIRGLRLGMTSDELFAIFPASYDREEFDRAQKLKTAVLPPNYGHTIFSFSVSSYTTKDRFTGISDFNFELFDGRLVSITAQYSNVPNFDSLAQFMEIVTKQFGLPEFKEWVPELNGLSLLCEGFTFHAHGIGSITLIDPSFKKIMEDRRKADEAKKREGFKL